MRVCWYCGQWGPFPKVSTVGFEQPFFTIAELLDERPDVEVLPHDPLGRAVR